MWDFNVRHQVKQVEIISEKGNVLNFLTTSQFFMQIYLRKLNKAVSHIKSSCARSRA